MRQHHFGSYSLIRDYGARADPLTVVNVRPEHRIGRIELAVDLLNMFDAKKQRDRIFTRIQTLYLKQPKSASIKYQTSCRDTATPEITTEPSPTAEATRLTEFDRIGVTIWSRQLSLLDLCIFCAKRCHWQTSGF